MEELDKIEVLLQAVKSVKSEQKRFNRLSEKRTNMSIDTHTQKAIQNCNADLNWCAMELDKRKTDVARLFKGGICDVGTYEKEYNPSSFHKYRY